MIAGTVGLSKTRPLSKRRQHCEYRCRPRARRQRRTDARGQLRRLRLRLSARAADLRDQKIWRRAHETRVARPPVVPMGSLLHALFGRDAL